MSFEFDVQPYIDEGNFKAGIDRCNTVLSKTPDEPLFLSKKLRLLYASGDDDAGDKLLKELSGKPVKGTFTSHLGRKEPYENVCLYEGAVAEKRANLDAHPRPSTYGPEIAKLWDLTIKQYGSAAAKQQALSARFEKAVLEGRLTDAHQALIQLKALLPKSRMIYLAHAAFTQMISQSKDDIHNKLALMLARKAVTDGFDADKDLDVRVPGQIFAIQSSTADLEKIKERSKMADSKHAFEALQEMAGSDDNAPSEGVDVSLDSLDINEDGNTLEWLTNKVEALEALYSQSVAMETRPDVILRFAIKAIQLFRIGTTINTIHHPFADACFLAISALVQIFQQTDDTSDLYRAAFLAEVLLSFNEHVHEARYILILIYMRLGLGSLAMRYFESLRIKEIQFDTVGHTLFTDIAVTHPHRCQIGKKKVLDPIKVTEQATNMYIRHEHRIADNVAGVIQHGQTGMLFDLQELRYKLNNSYTHRLFLLERRRLARLTNVRIGTDTVQEFPRVTNHWLETNDTRDFKGAFHYGFGVEKALHGGSEATLYEAILFRLIVDQSWSCIDKTGMVEDTGLLQDKFELHSNSASPEQKSTLIYQITDLAYQILCLVEANSDKALTEHIAAFASRLDSLVRHAESLISRTASAETAAFLAQQGHLLRSHFRLLEAFKLVCATRGRFYKRKDEDEKVLEALAQGAERAREAFGKVLKSAGAVVGRVEGLGEGVKGLVLGAGGEDDGVGKALGALGQAKVAKFVKDVLAAAKEGWEGVGLVKV